MSFILHRKSECRSGSCVAKAGYNEAEQEVMFELLESLTATAKLVHA